MPMLSCTVTAVAGNVWSGVVVARKIASISAPVRPAAFSARSPARVAMSEVFSPSPAMWRLRMPVRCAIHSSVVSTSLARSLFVKNFSGRYEPQDNGARALKFCFNFRRNLVGSKPRRNANGVRKADAVGAAVAFDAKTFEAEQAGAVIVTRIGAFGKSLKRAVAKQQTGRREQQTKLYNPRGFQRLFHPI